MKNGNCNLKEKKEKESTFSIAIQRLKFGTENKSTYVTNNSKERKKESKIQFHIYKPLGQDFKFCKLIINFSVSLFLQ